MVVAVNVQDRSGRLLLGAGSAVQEKHLKIFRAWGVVEVAVHIDSAGSEDGNSEPAIDPELWTQVKQDMTGFYVHTDSDHPAIKRLFDLCVERIARQRPAKP